MYSPSERIFKRVFDLAASVAGLVVLAPVLIVSGCAVRLSSPGPILFRQVRIGRGGKPFELLKFRTMRVGVTGPEVTARSDPRITGVGRWLRRTKLDELPALYNVAVGDLSLVGPRPEVPRYVALYSDGDRRFLQQFRPGITDPATVLFRNEEEILAAAPDPQRTYVESILPRKVGMYREYLERATFRSDLEVLLDTALVIARPSRAIRTTS